jgi:hypothetical protein
LDRCRRIETRLTRFLLDNGTTEINTEKPVWVAYDQTIDIPTDSVNLRDVLAVIPDGHHDAVDVVLVQRVRSRHQCCGRGASAGGAAAGELDRRGCSR